MAQEQRQLCLRRDWVQEGSSLALPTDTDRFLVLDAANMAPEGSAFRPLAETHCRGTIVALKPLLPKPGAHPGVAIMVAQEGDVKISLVGADGRVLRCEKELVAKAKVGDSLRIHSTAGELLFSFTVAQLNAVAAGPAVAEAAAERPAARAAGSSPVTAAAGLPAAKPATASAAAKPAAAAAAAKPAAAATDAAAVEGKPIKKKRKRNAGDSDAAGGSTAKKHAAPVATTDPAAATPAAAAGAAAAAAAGTKGMGLAERLALQLQLASQPSGSTNDEELEDVEIVGRHDAKPPRQSQQAQQLQHGKQAQQAQQVGKQQQQQQVPAAPRPAAAAQPAQAQAAPEKAAINRSGRKLLAVLAAAEQAEAAAAAAGHVPSASRRVRFSTADSEDLLLSERLERKKRGKPSTQQQAPQQAQQVQQEQQEQQEQGTVEASRPAAKRPPSQSEPAPLPKPQPQLPPKRPGQKGGQKVPEGAVVVSAEPNAWALRPDSQGWVDSIKPERLMPGVPADAPALRFFVQGSKDESGSGSGEAGSRSGAGPSSAAGGGSGGAQQRRTFAFFLPRYEKVLAYYRVPPAGDSGSSRVVQLVVTPAQFEADAGSKSKKWRESFRAETADGESKRLAPQLAALYPQAYGKRQAGTPAAGS